MENFRLRIRHIFAILFWVHLLWISLAVVLAAGQ